MRSGWRTAIAATRAGSAPETRHTRPPASRAASASTTASGYGVSAREKNSAGAGLPAGLSITPAGPTVS